MKKFLSLFLATLMLLAIVPMGITASAESVPVITTSVDKTTIEVGDIVTVTVSVSANSYLCALDYEFYYEQNDFEFVEGSQSLKGVFGYEASKNNVSSSGENVFKYSGTTSDTLTGPAAVLFTFQLKAKSTTGRVIGSVSDACTSTGGDDYKNVLATVAPASFTTITFKGPSSTVTPTDYFDIVNPSTKSISYKSGIILHVYQNATTPGNAKYEWSASNNNFKMEVLEDGTTCKIISNKSGNTTFTVNLVSSTGSILDTDTIEMTSKAGFFDKIIAFFRSLFGGNKILPQ